MKTTFTLLIANLKMTARNRQALFWSLIFPLLFIGIFGLFDTEKGTTATLSINDNAKTALTQHLTEAIGKVPAFTITSQTQTEREIGDAVKKGTVEYGIIIPAEAQNLGTPKQGTKPVALTVYYDPKNVQGNAIILGTLRQFTVQANMSLSQTPTLLTIDEKAVDAKKIKYIEFIMAGMLGMSVMQSGIIGISIGLSSQRENNILKKLMTTPLKLSHYVIATILNYLILGVIQTTIILLSSHYLFKANVYGNLASIYVLVILGTLIFLSLGFIVAAIAKTSQAAAGLAQLVTTPMMFLSGVFFSTELLPSLVQHIVKFLPLTPLLEALRNVALSGQSLMQVKTQVFYLLLWIVGSFILAISTFKFSENKD